MTIRNIRNVFDLPFFFRKVCIALALLSAVNVPSWKTKVVRKIEINPRYIAILVVTGEKKVSVTRVSSRLEQFSSASRVQLPTRDPSSSSSEPHLSRPTVCLHLICSTQIHDTHIHVPRG